MGETQVSHKQMGIKSSVSVCCMKNVFYIHDLEFMSFKCLILFDYSNKKRIKKEIFVSAMPNSSGRAFTIKIEKWHRDGIPSSSPNEDSLLP